MPLGNKLKLKGPLFPKMGKLVPVWGGPCSTGNGGGVTSSLLSRYLCCPERFRLKVIKGLCPAPQFNHKLEYGSLWHAAEEAIARQGPKALWTEAVVAYAAGLKAQYPTQREQIDHWTAVCCTQFAVYLKYWAKHPDVTRAKTLEGEVPFTVPFSLPSGRVVNLRGKRDRVDLIDGKVWLQENKTKGDINEGLLKRQLTFDLQTMLYLIALTEEAKTNPMLAAGPVAGVRYNVIRRPLSGGEGSITRHKATKNKPEESADSFYDRLRGVIDGTGLKQTGEPYTGPAYWFMRWEVVVSAGEVDRYKNEFLVPCLENLCDDYEWWERCHREPGKLSRWDYDARSRLFPDHTPRHYRRPFGVYNVMDEGGASELDEFLHTGSEAGLVRTTNLFPELQDR